MLFYIIPHGIYMLLYVIPRRKARKIKGQRDFCVSKTTVNVSKTTAIMSKTAINVSKTAVNVREITRIVSKTTVKKETSPLNCE